MTSMVTRSVSEAVHALSLLCPLLSIWLLTLSDFKVPPQGAHAQTSLLLLPAAMMLVLTSAPVR